MQTDNIIEKARRLGLDTGSSSSMADNLRHIAEQVGINEFNSITDVDKLEQTLDARLSEQNNADNIEQPVVNENPSPSPNSAQKFGQKEYNQAKDESGKFDKNHYKAKQQELDQKLNDAKKEKKLGDKKVGLDENGHNKYKKKNIVDKAKDSLNVAKARQDIISNKLSNAKANAYRLAHPGEALKDAAKDKAKNVAKNTGKKVGHAAANTGKKIGKGILKGIKIVTNIIMTNPILLVPIIFVTLLIFLIVILFSNGAGGGSKGILGYCNTNCDGISIKQTSLSKREFVDKVETYFENNTASYARVFSDNAGLIYDIGKNEGINPEMVVVRAILEGFSPESNCGGGFNNYWGMACYNGQGCGACAKYSSFEDGVRAYAQNIAQYETATDMMSRFAYIGHYWYNPGSSADGGCYYYPYIKEYMSPSRASEVERICNGSSCSTAGGNGCKETTDEDQKAYATWQVQKLVEVRKNVFGLDADSCNTNCYTGDYQINPNDELYANLQLLHGTSFEELLAANGMTVEKYNEFLQESIEKAGVGTRKGVVAAATTLIGSIAEMGYKLNYQWGGKYEHIGVNANWGTPADMSWLCSSASYGALYDSSTCYSNYKWHSFDCSGFVTWAVINGMQDDSITQSMLRDGNIALDPNKAVCKPGGALSSPGHIVLVIGIDDEQKKYIVAESTGSRLDTNTGGVKISYYSYNASGYSCNNFDDIYKD